MPNSVVRTAAIFAAAALFSIGRAAAIPVFAARYGVSCQTCHTVVPRLNGFGESFRAAGFRWPAKVPTHGGVPVSLKTNLAYSSQSDAGLPKAIVDEIEALSFGPVGSHLNFRMEQYIVDGGQPGRTRDAYVAYQTDPMRAWTGSKRLAFDITAGQMTLPLPDDPETQRPTQNHYAIYDQTVGENPFDFFDDRDGIDVTASAGSVETHVLLLHGDRMVTARIGAPALSFDAYRYDGTRLLPFGNDAFERSGFALTSIAGRARTSFVLQTGLDTNGGNGANASSSGGYVQEEWTLGDRTIGVVRYDAARALGETERSVTLSLNYRPVDRARLTLEGVFADGSSTLNAAALFAF